MKVLDEAAIGAPDEIGARARAQGQDRRRSADLDARSGTQLMRATLAIGLGGNKLGADELLMVAEGLRRSTCLTQVTDDL